MSTFYQTIVSYFTVYRKTASHAWNNMTPQDYGAILIFVALGGWFMMRSNLK